MTSVGPAGPAGPVAGARGVGESARAEPLATSWVLAGPVHTWGGVRGRWVRGRRVRGEVVR